MTAKCIVAAPLWP